MKFTQYYLDCLSQASYLIGDETTGRAVVVDPRRDIDEYVRDAVRRGTRDRARDRNPFPRRLPVGPPRARRRHGRRDRLLVGRRHRVPLAPAGRRRTDLARRRPARDPPHAWPHTRVDQHRRVGTRRRRGALRCAHRRRVVHRRRRTPRPARLARLHRDELADQLYDSLHDKLLTLPDATRVYPAHGAGSACGKNLSTETWSTIGDQRVENYALLAPDKQTFIDLVTEGQPPAPSYFVYDAVLNRKDRPLLDETAPLRALDIDEVDESGRCRSDCCSMAEPPRNSPVGTSSDRSTSASRGAMPSSPDRSLPERRGHRPRRRAGFRTRGP